MNEERAKQSATHTPPGILVTPEMVRAGLQEFGEHHYGSDIAYVLECVYRAMHYESPAASLSKSSQ